MAAGFASSAVSAEDNGVPTFVASHLTDHNFWVRYQAAQALSSSEEAAFPFGDQLAGLLINDESRLVRHEAAKAMCTLGSRASAYMRSIVHALGDSEMLVRRDAAKALHGIGAAASPHASVLAEKLHDPFWPVRWWAARTLGVLSSAAVPHGWVLVITSVTDVELAVREAAAKAVGAMGADASHHMETLSSMLISGGPQEQQRAGDAIAYALGDPDLKARNALVKGLHPLVLRAQQNVAKGTIPGRGAAGDAQTEARDRMQADRIEDSLMSEDWVVRRQGVDNLQVFGVVADSTAKKK